jgi:hypothetical protein
VDTPLSPGCHLTRQDCPSSPDSSLTSRYREVVGSLLWLASATRPDLAYAAQSLSRFSTNPGETHWREAKRCLRYLAGTTNLGLTYQRIPSSDSLSDTLYGFCDSDWGADPDTRRSVGAYVLFLTSGPVAWRCKLQPTVAFSTAEAEFMAASSTCTEVVWLRRILSQLGYPQRRPTPLYEDNQACIMISEHPTAYKGRAKHIDMRVHALRDYVAQHTVKLVRCPTYDMTADCLTKALPSPAFLRHRAVLLGASAHTAPVVHAFLAALFAPALSFSIYSSLRTHRHTLAGFRGGQSKI